MFEGIFQPMHLIILLIVALIVFGPDKLPQIGTEVGRGIKELKKALSDEDNAAKDSEIKKGEKEK